MTNQRDLLKRLFNAFKPFEPLQPGSPVYVDCREVRGDGDVITDLATNIEYSDNNTCQLYAGHRGAGKSTELLRLKEYLEIQKYFVVYFAAEEQDINPEDTEYADILLACTRHLLEHLKKADPQPLLDWLKGRWADLKDLATTEISLESLALESQISQYAKLTAKIRTEPTLRKKIRDKINPHTESLIEAINTFIGDGKKKLASGSELVIIADSLDRIVPIVQPDGRSNHDEIFIDRSAQLKGLDCHTIYTIPISMVYSNQAPNLKIEYDDPQVLPMIMVETPEGEVYELGVATIREIIDRRVKEVKSDLSLETDLFESREVLDKLCLMSGGHVRDLMLLMQNVIKRAGGKLPISARVVQRAITEARVSYKRSVQQEEWQVLADVSRSKKILNNQQYRNLLFNRCLLEYIYFDEQGEKQVWYDVHPLIKGVQEFQELVQ
ncbi:ATP-binding protein [Dapis sp. BLCC M229]|uniref:ATP-binding protein n=1 Tax=Dapis sp. BLCC M229 TaxID=3400188 RepID=UPI003CEA472D